MKILSATEMSKADQASFERLKLSSLAVMETAGRAVARLCSEVYSDRLSHGALIFVGGGNNGGDGFVVARALANLGIRTHVLMLKPISVLHGDALANAQSFLLSGGTVEELTAETWTSAEGICQIYSFGLIVDAIFGTGFNGAAVGFIAEVIDYLNLAAGNDPSLPRRIPVVSIDIASGVEADSGRIGGAAVKADITVALQCLCPGNVFYPGADLAGEVYLVDIGVSPELDEISTVPLDLFVEEDAASYLQQYFSDQTQEHKGRRGHLAVVGGSAGYCGAAKLSAQAALSSGAGLVSLMLPSSAAERLGPQLDELMSIGLADDGKGGFAGFDEQDLAVLLENKSAIVIGPGLGTTAGASRLLLRVLEYAALRDIVVVVDADGLNCLALDPSIAQFLSPKVVLTPHPGEMARLVNQSVIEIQESRLDWARKLSKDWNCVIVLKGARTITAAPDGRAFVNPAAVSTLATAGSGDVLAGIIGALAARGFESLEAATSAVFVHGCAGERAFELRGGVVGVLAGEVSSIVPQMINELVSCPLPMETVFCRKVLPGSRSLISNE